MDTVIEILEALEATNSRNDKEDILQENRENSLLRRVFIAAQDPYTVYYVNKLKMPPSVDPVKNGVSDMLIEWFLEQVLPQLSSRQVTGNAAKNKVLLAFGTMNALEQKWMLRVLLKNLRCGVQETTVNKIWPGSINSFSVALACTLKSEFVRDEGIKLLEPVTYPVRVEPKLDGLRCIAVKKDGEVTFFTRNGSILETLPKIKAAIEAINFDNIVFDGEAMGEDWNESASVLMSHKSHKDDSNIVYNIFDAMPLADWVAQETKLTYKDRVAFASYMLDDTQNMPLRQVPHIMAQNEAELKAYFAKCMDEGFEGVMLKSMDTLYEFKRSKNILKLKPCVTYEGVIVGHYEGRRGTKREGLFGGFEVVLPNGAITRLGGGFTDLLKAEIQIDGPETYVGIIVECEAQPDPMTKDGLTGDGKMRFPVFMRFRDATDVDPSVVEMQQKVTTMKCTMCNVMRGEATHPNLPCPSDDTSPHDWRM